MNMLPYAIDLFEVSKRYTGKVDALRSVSLKVPKGEIFGLLGPNGAGKSTLLKVLLTVIRPSVCRGVMLGQPIGHRATLRKVGYLPEHARFPEYLTGRQVITYTAGLADVPRKLAKKRAGELLELVGMAAWADKRMRVYSKGMRQRIGLAQALVNDPEIVFLDEPTDGVDPQGRKEMREMLKQLRSQGMTLFINSHILGELEMVCDSVAILNKGGILKQGRLRELTEASNQFEIHYEGVPREELQLAFAERLGAQFSVGSVTVKAAAASDVQELIDALRGEGIILEKMGFQRQSLEDLFMESVKGNGPGGYLGE